MHTPPKKLPPKARISRPMTSPTCSSSETSHVAPRAMETGKAVAAPATQPRGPSTKRVPGSPSRSTAPCTMGTRLYPSDRKRASPSQKSESPSSNQSRSPSSSSAWSSSATSVTSRPSCIDRTASSKIVGIGGNLSSGFRPRWRLAHQWAVARCAAVAATQVRLQTTSPGGPGSRPRRGPRECVGSPCRPHRGPAPSSPGRARRRPSTSMRGRSQLGVAAPRRGWPGEPGQPRSNSPARASATPRTRCSRGSCGAPPIASACTILASARAKASSM